jgi:hypothetical protein
LTKNGTKPEVKREKRKEDKEKKSGPLAIHHHF